MQPELFGKLGVGRLDEDRSVRKDDRRNAAHAVVDALDFADLFGMLLDVNVFVVNALLAKKRFCPPAVSAPVRAVHANGGRGGLISVRHGTPRPDAASDYFGSKILMNSSGFCKPARGRKQRGRCNARPAPRYASIACVSPR